MKETLLRLWSNDDGQDLVEYGLAIALISVVAIGAMTTVGTDIKNTFTTVAGSL